MPATGVCQRDVCRKVLPFHEQAYVYGEDITRVGVGPTCSFRYLLQVLQLPVQFPNASNQTSLYQPFSSSHIHLMHFNLNITCSGLTTMYSYIHHSSIIKALFNFDVNNSQPSLEFEQ